MRIDRRAIIGETEIFSAFEISLWESNADVSREPFKHVRGSVLAITERDRTLTKLFTFSLVLAQRSNLISLVSKHIDMNGF